MEWNTILSLKDSGSIHEQGQCSSVFRVSEGEFAGITRFNPNHLVYRQSGLDFSDPQASAEYQKNQRQSPIDS